MLLLLCKPNTICPHVSCAQETQGDGPESSDTMGHENYVPKSKPPYQERKHVVTAVYQKPGRDSLDVGVARVQPRTAGTGSFHVAFHVTNSYQDTAQDSRTLRNQDGKDLYNVKSQVHGRASGLSLLPNASHEKRRKREGNQHHGNCQDQGC